MSDHHPDVPVPPAPEAQQPRRNWALIVGMAAVLGALVLYTMMPEPHVDLNAPPPAADGAGDGTAPEDLVFIGKPAPLDFTLKDMNGIDVNLASFKGKVILLNFWATWCGPCKLEIPWLIELQNRYRDDLVVLGFSVDDTVEKMRPYAEGFGINYPLLVGLGREDVQDAFGPLWAIPVTVIIDRDGRISYRHSGIATQEEFDQAIQAAL